MINCDICIIGAGPVGLFAVFEAGLLRMRCHLIDALPQTGGQLSEVYPHKPIYDIPGYPVITAQELVDKLMEQTLPFSPTFTLGERVETFKKNNDGQFELTTNEGTKIAAKAIVIAAGLGSFEPRKPAIPALDKFEKKGVLYWVKHPKELRHKQVVIAGGGDSALDWTIHLADIAKRVTLVHRGDTFRGTPESAARVFELAQQNKIDLILKSNVVDLLGQDRLESVELLDHDRNSLRMEADYFIPLFGLSPKLGPIAQWGLGIDKNAITVNTKDYSTNIDGVYAIGDINTYEGKLKLILCGFHEAALMAQSAFKYVYPDEKLTFKYTTVYGINPL